MLKRGDAKVLRMVVKYLRACTGKSQDKFGEAVGVVQNTVSQYELGEVPVSDETLRCMADEAGVPWTVVVSLSRFYAAAHSLAARLDRRLGGTSGAATLSALRAETFQTIVDAVLIAVTPYFVEEERAEAAAASPEARLAEAAETWAALQRFPPERRRELVAMSPDLAGNRALARVICEASAEAAEVDVAREYAELSLFVAQQVPG